MANMLEDWLSGIGDKIDTWFQNILTSGITGTFKFMNSILNASYTSATEEDGLFAAFITKHPANFTGTASGNGITIWTTIETLCNNAVVPIAGFILAIVLVNDLIQACIRGNSFREIDVDFFVKWIIKCLCGIILVSNTYYIASGLFSFGTEVTANGISSLFGTSSSINSLNTEMMARVLTSGTYSNGELLIILLLAIVVFLILCVMLAAIVLVLANRIIEVFMYLSISPIPVATMMNDEWGQIGKNWIKAILALSFQGFFVVVAMAIFKTIYNNVITSLFSEDSNLIVNMVMLAGYAGALIFTILRSGSISKSVFNAS